MNGKPFDGLGYTAGMRRGYTTGACAAAAARGALVTLLEGTPPDEATITLPGGQSLPLPLTNCSLTDGGGRCGVVKDSGDDPDGTDGMTIFAEVRLRAGRGVSISGGQGVGRITRKGLPLPPGEWAINPVPRAMIEREIASLLPSGMGAEVIISAPEGEERAKKTWNPRLGIEGGISILGTSGVVEPKSEAAYLASIDLYISSALAFDSPRPGRVFLAPGYVGEKCLTERFEAPRELIVRVGDHVGHSLEECAARGAGEIFFFCHVSKGAKVAAGLFNTHCRWGDARLETLAAWAGAEGASREQIRELLALPLAEEGVPLLQRWGLTSVFYRVAERALERCSLLLGGKVPLGVAVTDLEGRILGSSPKIGEEVRSWQDLPSSE